MSFPKRSHLEAYAPLMSEARGRIRDLEGYLANHSTRQWRRLASDRLEGDRWVRELEAANERLLEAIVLIGPDPDEIAE